MLAWLKNGLAMKTNGKPVLCDLCPCTTGIFPGIKVIFPFPLGGFGPDYGVGWANYGWSRLTIDDYDPRTNTWLNPPNFECEGNGDNRSIFYFGFTDLLWSNSYSRHESYTGAYSVYVPGVDTEYPPYPTYVNVFTTPTVNPENQHSIRFEFSNLPEKLSSGSGHGIQVKPDHTYIFDVYDTEGIEDVLIFSGKIKAVFAANEIRVYDVDEPDVEYYIYGVPVGDEQGDYPYIKPPSLGYYRYEPYFVYDSDDNLLFRRGILEEFSGIYRASCIPDIDYSVVGRCDYSKRDCKGCLTDTSLLVTQDSVAQNLNERCINGKNIYRDYSYHYSLIASGFETQADANDYIDEHYNTLIETLNTRCAGDPWYIIGYCECQNENCELCMALEDNIFTICSNDIKNCFEHEGKYYTHTILANGQTFSNSTSAAEYLQEHLDELKSELRIACPECVEGKYYGVHVWPDWHDGINGSNCHYGYPYPFVWRCDDIIYYSQNPLEFELLYGENATWEKVIGPFDAGMEAVDAMKLYICKTTQWRKWRCEGDTYTANIPLTFFVKPNYSGGDTCLGGTYPHNGCGGYGSRKGPFEIILSE